MAIQKQFILRYREEGHVRFQMPARFCEPDTAAALTAALSKLDGVYRVNVYRSARKLSIRYQETRCDFKTLATHLYQRVAELEQKPAASLQPQRLDKVVANVKDRLRQSAPSLWVKQKWDEARETAQAARILANGLKKNKAIIDNPEKFVTDFFNDVLALYLIKLHWEPITKQWIPNPFKYRYEWLAVSYLLYLLMRSRNPKS